MENRTRKYGVLLRLTKDEYDTLREKSKQSGLPMQAVLRQWIRGNTVRAKPPESYLTLCRELSTIGNNINQIARFTNGTGKADTAMIRQATELMRQIWVLVRENI